jgi:hypothetical protein
MAAMLRVEVKGSYRFLMWCYIKVTGEWYFTVFLTSQLSNTSGCLNHLLLPMPGSYVLFDSWR